MQRSMQSQFGTIVEQPGCVCILLAAAALANAGGPCPPDEPQVVSLITIEVHARDVLEKLGKSGCTSTNDFDWVSQLRFYWDREAAGCVVKQVRALVMCLARDPRLAACPQAQAASAPADVQLPNAPFVNL
jgi:hypothetical protein